MRIATQHNPAAGPWTCICIDCISIREELEWPEPVLYPEPAPHVFGDELCYCDDCFPKRRARILMRLEEIVTRHWAFTSSANDQDEPDMALAILRFRAELIPGTAPEAPMPTERSFMDYTTRMHNRCNDTEVLKQTG